MRYFHFLALACLLALGAINGFAQGTFPGTGTRVPLLQATTYYANASTGSDSNPCTSTLLCQSGQRLINLQNNIDNQGYPVTLSLADGNYPASVVCNGPFVGGGAVTLIGDMTTPANVILNNNATANAVLVENGCQLVVEGMELKGNTDLAQAIDFGRLSVSTLVLTGTAGGCHFAARHPSFLVVTGPLTITGANANCHANFANNAVFQEQNQTITFTGNVTWAGGFAVGSFASSAKISGNTFVLGGNTISGPHFSVDGGAILAAGGGCTTLPGSSAGVSTNNGLCY